MLFLLGTLRFHFKPDQRVSVGFCSNRSVIELNICFFERSEKKTIFGNMDAEYALDRENGAQILMGDNQGFFLDLSWCGGGCAPKNPFAHQGLRTKPFFSNLGFAHQERTKDFLNFTLTPKMYLLLVYNSSHVEIETPSSAKTSFLLRTFGKNCRLFFLPLVHAAQFFLVRPW